MNSSPLELDEAIGAKLIADDTFWATLGIWRSSRHEPFNRADAALLRQPHASAIKPVLPAAQEVMVVTPQRPHRRQRHYAASATEFGCPPSVCAKASPNRPNATPYNRNQAYEQAEQLYRQAEELYLHQLELQRAGQGR
jgi:hypothetical protein